MGSTSLIKIGPVGTTNASATSFSVWDEMEGGDIVQIFISYDQSRIYSLQFLYSKNGNLVLSNRHGSNKGYKFDAVKFDLPVEYLTCVSGYDSSDGFTSMSFTSNLRTYGPFGQHYEWDKEFRFHMGKDNQFCGFFGSSDSYILRSIGLYIDPFRTQPIQSEQDTLPVERSPSTFS